MRIINNNIIHKLYSELLQQDSGVRCVKFDLHIHTPASNDFKVNSNLHEEQQYLEILDNAIKNELEIIAVTDHNSFDGYNKLQKILSNDSDLKNKYKNLLILCGIEITCYSKHLLAVFDRDFSEDQQTNFLTEIGIPLEDKGTENALADVFGPSVLLEKIHNYGGISILAHADDTKGFLHSACRNSGDPRSDLEFSGKSLIKIVTSPYLHGIQIANQSNKVKISNLFKNQYRREPPLAYLSFSDCHGNKKEDSYQGKSGKPIGENYSIAKLSYISFNSLKMALSDPETRIIDEIPHYDYAHIIGCAVDSDVIKNENTPYCFIRFHPGMNCIIGARGTGKSTILEIVQYMISFKNPKIAERFKSAVLFICVGEETFAISAEPKFTYDGYTNEANTQSNIKIYRKEKSKFILAKSKEAEALKNIITVGYQQRQFYEYGKNTDLILGIVDDYITWQNKSDFEKIQSQIKNSQKRLEEYFSKYSKTTSLVSKDFIQYLKEEKLFENALKNHQIISKNIARLHDVRDEMVKKLNSLLKRKVFLTLSRKIPKKEYLYYTNSGEFSRKVAHKNGKYYDYDCKISDFMKRIFDFGSGKPNFDFFKLLAEDNYEKILQDYNLTNVKRAEEYLKNIRKCITSDELLLTMSTSLKMEYNINIGKHHEEFFRKSEQLSMGQQAVALLLVILNVSYELSDKRPLLMDQPEDDLDNSYIYNTLVSEFRRSKIKRQIIISSHNANIPVASDAENIIVLKHNGSSGYISKNGGIDKPSVAENVLEILEGGKDALHKRSLKYMVK